MGPGSHNVGARSAEILIIWCGLDERENFFTAVRICVSAETAVGL